MMVISTVMIYVRREMAGEARSSLTIGEDEFLEKGFYLDEFHNRPRTEAGQVGLDGGALRLNSETGAALPVGRDAKIRNEAVVHDLAPDPNYKTPNDRLA